MPENTNITPGKHFDDFIAQPLNEKKLVVLRNLLAEGERSGIAEYDYQTFMQELDNELA